MGPSCRSLGSGTDLGLRCLSFLLSFPVLDAATELQAARQLPRSKNRTDTGFMTPVLGRPGSSGAPPPGMCQDSPNTPNAIVSRAPNPGPLGLRFSSDLSPESSQKGEKLGACPPDLGRRSGGWRQLGCRSAAIVAGLLSQGFDVRPEITPGRPFSFGERGQGHVVADAGQRGVLLQAPELPDDRGTGLGLAGFELPRQGGPLGLQPLQGLLPQCGAGGPSGGGSSWLFPQPARAAEQAAL